MENNMINDARMKKIIRLEQEIDRMDKKLNVLRKDIYYSKIDANLCKGHVHYSHTEEGVSYGAIYVSKNFKMKGKYVPSFLSLINHGNEYYKGEFFVMPPEHYTYHLHDDDDYLVSIDYYGHCFINIFNLSKDRLNRKREERGLFDYE